MSKRPTPIPNHRRVKPIAARDPAAGHKHTARRQLIAAAGLSGATAALLHWTKPAIQTLFLPAHAQSSPTPTPSPSPSSGSPTPTAPQSRQTFYLSRDESDTYSLLLDLDGNTNASTDSDSANMVAQFNFTQIDTIRVTKLGGGRNWQLQSSTFTEGQHYAAVDLEHEKFNIELTPVDQNGGNTAGSNAAAFESYQIDLQLRLANSRTGPPDLLIIEIENRSGVPLTFQVAGVPANTTYALRINYPSAANPTRLNGNTTQTSNTISVQATIPFGTTLGTDIPENGSRDDANAAASVVLTPQTDYRFSGPVSGPVTHAYTCATSADCTDDKNVALFSDTDEIFTIPDNGPQSVIARIGKMEVNATETITLTLSGLSSFIPPLYTLTLAIGTFKWGQSFTVTSSASRSDSVGGFSIEETGSVDVSENSNGTVFTIQLHNFKSRVVFRSVPCATTLTIGGHTDLKVDNASFPLSNCAGQRYTQDIDDRRMSNFPAFSGGSATQKATTSLTINQPYVYNSGDTNSYFDFYRVNLVDPDPLIPGLRVRNSISLDLGNRSLFQLAQRIESLIENSSFAAEFPFKADIVDNTTSVTMNFTWNTPGDIRVRIRLEAGYVTA